VCIHTAALKHVDKAEYAPGEYIDVNVNGTLSVLESCDRTGVTRMVFVSTDKAVQPVNLYGATKLCAERATLAACAQNRNIYTVVRYGNVLDSRGSALNLFRDLARSGASALPVTDEAMTRFGMTFDMALRLIDQAIDGPPQVVYVAKAKSFTVRDLCYAMDKRIDRKGPRPGEKMHETLVSRYEAPYTTDWGDHYRIAPRTPADTDVSYAGGKPVPDGWEYTSGLTHERLNVEELRTWCDSIL
jgi:UDP-N-acetylglucosamine 4,6-dehydratase